MIEKDGREELLKKEADKRVHNGVTLAK